MILWKHHIASLTEASWILIGFPLALASPSFPFQTLFKPLYSYRRSRKLLNTNWQIPSNIPRIMNQWTFEKKILIGRFMNAIYTTHLYKTLLLRNTSWMQITMAWFFQYILDFMFQQISTEGNKYQLYYPKLPCNLLLELHSNYWGPQQRVKLTF